MRGLQQRNPAVRRWAVGLALLALAVQGLAPQGFMFSREAGHETIVMCTGHGPAHTIADLTGQPRRHKPSTGDAPCLGVGHGVAVAPAIAAQAATRVAWPSSRPPAAQPAVAPGRGLAAPPPPSQAPPVRIL